MINDNDSLARLAHAHGITDLEIEEQQAVLAEIASQQVIRQRIEEEAEDEDRQALSEFSENEDIDYGYHDQWEF